MKGLNAFLGFGFVWVLLNKSSYIVDILISVKRTFVNEGQWEPETARGASDDIGNLSLIHI